jgi:hypothetical protein
VQNSFHGTAKFPPQPLHFTLAIHTTLFFLFSAQRSIGNQANRVKVSALV